MQKYLTKKGFIQIPLLIGVIFVAILSTSVAGYFGVKHFNLNQVNTADDNIQEVINIEKENIIEIKKEFVKNLDTQTEEITKQSSSNTQNIELKIEKCKAEKENASNNAILKINQAINNRLEEVRSSLEEQYRDSVNKIFDYRDAQISRITNNPELTANGKLELMSEYGEDATKEADILYKNQQVFWTNQKNEIENSKENAINEINLLLSQEYTKCLNK